MTAGSNAVTVETTQRAEGFLPEVARAFGYNPDTVGKQKLSSQDLSQALGAEVTGIVSDQPSMPVSSSEGRSSDFSSFYNDHADNANAAPENEAPSASLDRQEEPVADTGIRLETLEAA